MARRAQAFSYLLILSCILLFSSLLLFQEELCSWCKDRYSVVIDRNKTWCAAKPSTDEATLTSNLNCACSQVDCSVLQRGCSCFYPDTLMSHASIAMNLYYQSRGRNYWNCYFKSSALIVTTDPSYGSCVYAHY